MIIATLSDLNLSNLVVESTSDLGTRLHFVLYTNQHPIEKK